MKKLYFFIAFIVITLSANAQHTTYDIGRWTLGGNIGGAYQKGDISNKLFGFGYGATLEYRLYNKKYRFFGFSLRGRYLKSETFGLGYQPHESFISLEIQELIIPTSCFFKTIIPSLKNFR